MKYMNQVELKNWRYGLCIAVLLMALLPMGTLQSQTGDSIQFFGKAVSKEKFNKEVSLDLSIQDKIPGLYMIGKSGIPGEGAYLNLRGIHTFTASNMPLLVLNGIPYFENEDISQIVNGYSRSVFSALNVKDIKSITVLNGAEAALYGSLGSNGVIFIETEQATSTNLETRISFSSQFGLRTPQKSIPTLGVSEFKGYFQDIAGARYGNATTLRTDYPFLQNEDNYYSYLFNNNTNWMSLVQSPALVTDNVFRVEGGDEIAKYNLSFGYTSDGGVVGTTKTDRYNTLINANILVSRKVDIFTNVGLSYIVSKLQEQGMTESTNPILAASLAMPMLSPYKKESDGNILNRYASYNEWNVNANPTYAYENVSNPLAIVNTLLASDKIYDANIRFGLNYRANRYLKFTGMMNISLNYTEESIFIPGVTNKAIVPQYYGVGFNTVRRGVIQNRNNYYGLNADYNRTFNEVHQLKGSAGVRYMDRTLESDFGSGYNTSNDFYQSLSYVTDDRDIAGNNIEWKWLNYFVNADYTYNNILKAHLNVALDGSSVSGVDAPRFGLFPAFGIKAMLGNMNFLPEEISMLNISADVSRTGNSRFSSNYAKNYYQNYNLFNLGTIVRSNVPNTQLEWEKNDELNLGVEISAFKNLIDVQANFYTAKAHDLLVARNISSVYGSSEYYDNTGEIATQGMEIALNVHAIRTKDFDWSLGGSVATAKSKILSLGNSNELAISYKGYNNDDAMVLMRVGESPYSFYGYRTNGIYATSAEAAASGLKNIYGDPYQAGDVIFVNENSADNVINAKDKVLLGSATPDFFGTLNTSLRYKKLTLIADFGYSVGNKAYNALRRELESMSTFHNQSVSVLNRWQIEGQSASLPRASYGDVAGNNVFSDRWIEDASYLKLRNLTLQYNFGNLWNLCQSGNVYISGQNLLTFTKYLGSDPEFSYSYAAWMQGFDYAKAARPKTVQIGFQLFF